MLFSNCANNPTKPGDYVFTYGTALELLKRVRLGEVIRYA